MKLFSGKPQGCGAPSARAKAQFGLKIKSVALAGSDLQAEMQQMLALSSFLTKLPELAEDTIEAEWQALTIPEEIKTGSKVTSYDNACNQIFALFHYLKKEGLLSAELIAKLDKHFETAATLKPSSSPVPN